MPNEGLTGADVRPGSRWRNSYKGTDGRKGVVWTVVERDPFNCTLTDSEGNHKKTSVGHLLAYHTYVPVP